MTSKFPPSCGVVSLTRSALACVKNKLTVPSGISSVLTWFTPKPKSICVSLILLALGLNCGVTVLTPVTCPSASTVITGIEVAFPNVPATTPLLPL